MSLNIKDKETHELVKELAQLKGTSLTAAVKLAVKSELERDKAALAQAETPKRRKRSEVLQEFAREFASRVKDPVIHSWDIDELLYDEDGLPK